MLLLSFFFRFAQEEWSLIVATHILLLYLHYWAERFGVFLVDIHIEGDLITGLPFHVHVFPPPDVSPGQTAWLIPEATLNAYDFACHRAFNFLVYLAWAHLIAKLTQNIWGSLQLFGKPYS